jgi:putative addiction module CopG family antidote
MSRHFQQKIQAGNGNRMGALLRRGADWCIISSVMNITLPPDLEAYVEQHVRRGAFTSASELIQEAVRRKMEADTWMEQKVIEAEQTEVSALTHEDLRSVRRLIRQPRAARTS